VWLILQPELYRWNAYALPFAVVGLALFVLAGVIYSRQRASRVAMLFCAMIVLVGIWFGGFTMMLLAAGPRIASIWGRLGLAAVALLPAAIYDFTATAFRLAGPRRLVARIIWSVAALFAAISLLSRGFVESVAEHPWGYYPVAGPALRIFLLFFAAVLVAHLADTVSELRRSDARRRRRLLRMLSAFLVVYLATADFLPMFGLPLRPIGFVPVLSFIAIAWGTIRKHRLQVITAARAAREILATMADALFVIDAGGKIRVVNGAVTTLLGFKEVELLGRSIDALEPMSGDATITRTLAELSRRGPIRDQERVFRSREGGTVDVSVSISPVSEEDEQRGAVIIARDIRERKVAEEEMRSFTARLEHSNRELEEFAYVASHDLQEPLRKIQAFGDRLETKYAAELPAQARDYIDRMRSAAKRMQVLINDLLSFSRVSTRAQPFVPVDLGAVAKEVARDLEVRAHETGGSIVIGELPTIEADPLQMRQLLQNLAGNALKFHRPDVPPVVTIEGGLANGSCRIVVTDNGVGFEEKYAERIFTMFERLHGRGVYEGTGIGLAICRRIAERHGGSIVARSVPGEGATFTVTVPAHHPLKEGMNGSTGEAHRHPAGG
jgi:PAS domain S-box-containing protein